MNKVLSGSGGEEVTLLEEKINKTTNQNPKFNYLWGRGLIGSKSLLKK